MKNQKHVFKDAHTRRHEAAISEEVNKANFKAVLWFKLDWTDHLTRIQVDNNNHQQEGQKYTKGDGNNQSLTINQICFGDGGRYCCFAMSDDEEVSSCGWDLRVIPQGTQIMPPPKNKNK